jgi:hypothetical protein
LKKKYKKKKLDETLCGLSRFPFGVNSEKYIRESNFLKDKKNRSGGLPIMLLRLRHGSRLITSAFFFSLEKSVDLFPENSK